MEFDTEDIVMIGGDYSATQSDWQRGNEDQRSQSEFQFQTRPKAEIFELDLPQVYYG
jgi:hypothetical protein